MADFNLRYDHIDSLNLGQDNFGDLCDTTPTPNVNNTAQNTSSPKVGTAQNTTIDPIPSCIGEEFWNLLSQNEMDVIINNQTTCQLVDGEYVTNLPSLGYRLIPETEFCMQICQNIAKFMKYNQTESIICKNLINWIHKFSNVFGNSVSGIRRPKDICKFVTYSPSTSWHVV